MANVLAVLEQRDGVLRKVSHEVVAAARGLADGLGGTVDALLMATGPVSGAEALGASGADRVLGAAHADFGLYHPDGFAATVAAIAGSYGAVVFAATAQGRDLAPRVAAKLGVGCATDVTAAAVEGGRVVVTRPVYAGKALQRVAVTGAPAVLSVRPNTFPALTADQAGTAESVTVPEFTTRVTVKEIKAPAEATLDVTEAPIVVSGGRGLKDPTNFKLIEDLAAA
ncbi:MAG: electron transfer flavoprotein subunit alpha/FixB family protein, partial [Gemmatimonadales bacterium]